MAYSAITGMPFIPIGHANRDGLPNIAALTTSAMSAVNAAQMWIGQVFWIDGGTHTVDTTGSSSLGWMAGSLTFANAGTTFKVGLAAVDTTNGPPGRAVNVAGVITFDVSASFTGGGGGITANTWTESVPTSGTKTVAHRDIVAFCLQMTARGGTDSVSTQTEGPFSAIKNMPVFGTYSGAAFGSTTSYPNCVITANDGTIGFIYGSFVASKGSTTQTWNSGSSPNEYGNLFTCSSPLRILGIYAGIALSGGSADCDFVLYSDPLGTPVAERTVSQDATIIRSTAAQTSFPLIFDYYDVSASTPFAIIAKPSTVNNVSMIYKTFNAQAHQKSETIGVEGYAVSRGGGSGAFAQQNSGLDRFTLGFLVSAIQDGIGTFPTSYAHA